MPDTGTPDVTILVPAKNEENTIREVVERVMAVPVSKQVIVIDDGSTDKTPTILADLAGEVVVLRNEASIGKGASIRKGLPYAIGKVVVIQDADLEYAPEELAKLVEPIVRGQYGVVYGTRFLHGFPKGMALPNKLVNKLLVWAVALLFGRRVTDEATCYKAIRRDLLEEMDLQCQRFEFCPEVTAKAIRLGEPIHEVAISYEPRTKEAGKKIRWTDAPEAFWTLWKYRKWRP
ncbi:MAG: glycosyltransferase family 2 protein [Armatimonadetes bacterium]|nr:glycosyltransferase family 2 protein [Armatimonadota bacterium]